MNQDEAHGKVENLKGRVKEAAGVLTGNPALEQEGADQRTDGAVQEGVGTARRKVGDFVEDVGKSIKK
jgi:uncharacterized protein YjbJ (UPF0337 family)